MKMNFNSKHVRANEHESAVSQKHETNLKKNTLINFQIGLIVSLLVAYFSIESTFAVTPPPEVVHKDLHENIEEYSMSDVKVDHPKVEKIVAKVPEIKPVLIVDIKKVKNETPVEDTKITSTEDPIVDVNDIATIEEGPDSLDPIPVDFVENVPVYPGCEGLKTNQERKDCMSDKINKVVQRNFDTSIAERYGLIGVQKIYVQFTINEQGVVSKIEVRAPSSSLEKEAKRVIEKLPQMKPGKQHNQNVKVKYLKPIVFRVQ
ncbi:energy transducer TonB [Zhouia sp. PK063]|uniref:energy transducer TonB n=1 Tax=Zhouia sp. PK063 TaxID=3373602 RepID=UPI00378990E0